MDHIKRNQKDYKKETNIFKKRNWPMQSVSVIVRGKGRRRTKTQFKKRAYETNIIVK